MIVADYYNRIGIKSGTLERYRQRSGDRAADWRDITNMAMDARQCSPVKGAVKGECFRRGRLMFVIKKRIGKGASGVIVAIHVFGENRMVK